MNGSQLSQYRGRMLRARTTGVLLAATVCLTAGPAAAQERCPALEPVSMRWLVESPATAPPAPTVTATTTTTAPIALPETPKSMQARVAFWARIWGELDSNQFLVGARQNPGRVLAEVDCRGMSQAKCDDRLVAARAKGAQKAGLSMQDVVAVEGRRDGLAAAFAKAGPELAAAETMFERVKVPGAYARLAFVESMWRTSAVSGAGAVGPYQIVERTGDRYLMIKHGVDERRDPIRASLAAAKYLRRMKLELGSWSMALTAYNAGPTRLRALAKARKTKDVGRLADMGDKDGFGFQAQNYAAQVMAVASVTTAWQVPAAVTTDRAVKVGGDAKVLTIAQCLDRDWQALVRANPALTDDVASGKKPVPRGYVLKVPAVALADES